MKLDLDCDVHCCGVDLSVYKQDDDLFTIMFKHPCGEVIKGWCDMDDLCASYEFGRFLRNPALYDMTEPHCDDEYCVEAFEKYGL